MYMYMYLYLYMYMYMYMYPDAGCVHLQHTVAESPVEAAVPTAEKEKGI